MEIIHAKVAYANTLLAEHEARINARAIIAERCFITRANNAAQQFCRCFAISCISFVNIKFLPKNRANMTTIHGFFFYFLVKAMNHFLKKSYNPCGIIVGWGPNANEWIEDFFRCSEELYKGE